MKAVEFIYQDMQIHFALGNNKNVMINATEMAKAFGRRTKDFLKTDHAKAYIKFLERAPNGARSDEKIIDNRGHMGIYFNRKLALKFAIWLDVAFESWVIDTIDEILFGNYNKHSKAVLNKLQAEKELHEIASELLIDNPQFEKYLQLQKLIKTTDAEKQKAIKAQISQIKMDFTDN